MKEPIEGNVPAAYRGLRNKPIRDDRGLPQASMEAFLPDPRTSAARTDGGSEVSVNWHDDAGDVLAFTMTDKKNSQFGVAILPEGQLRNLSAWNLQAAVTAERDPLPGNPYHGNLVFRAGLSQQNIRMLAGLLAFVCQVKTRE